MERLLSMRQTVGRLLAYRWRILAISAATVVVASIATFGYLSYKELPIQGVDPKQWTLADVAWTPKGGAGKDYRVEIESIDEAAGTIRLKVNLRPPSDTLVEMEYMRLSGSKTISSRFPIPLSFDQLMISDVTEQFLISPKVIQDPASAGYHRRPLRFLAEFSESQPQAAHADVTLIGDPWWYPFDQYFMAADLNCDIILKDDKQQSHELEDAGYYLSTQVPPICRHIRHNHRGR